MTEPPGELEESILHDDTIQMLFAISLKVEYCLAVLEDSPQQAKAGLDHVLTDINSVIGNLRNRITTLNSW